MLSKTRGTIPAIVDPIVLVSIVSHGKAKTRILAGIINKNISDNAIDVIFVSIFSR
ncbi:MAG: hypothetical protein LBJ32_04710 [Oscillospiraceae bacterium]|jgi:hypothetical protein|nr:hypothetical protein [Oscillospiraceae bacterium]